MATKTAYGRKAKRRDKALTIAAQHALNGNRELQEYYNDIAERLEKQLREARVCIACGRPLRNVESLEEGLGPECLHKKQESETDEHPSASRS